MSQEFFIKRVKDSIMRLGLLDERAVEPDVRDERVDARESVRQLSRSRVADLLRQLRAVHGFTYEQVQEMTGLSQQLLFDMEYKDRRLTLNELHALAQCYQVSAGDILGVEIDGPDSVSGSGESR
jgi:hypothetical protein